MLGIDSVTLTFGVNRTIPTSRSTPITYTTALLSCLTPLVDSSYCPRRIEARHFLFQPLTYRTIYNKKRVTPPSIESLLYIFLYNTITFARFKEYMFK